MAASEIHGHSGGGLRAWLTTETPASRLQARAVQAYLVWLAFARNPLGLVGLGIVLALLLVALFAPWLANHDPYAQDLAARLQPPGSPDHWFGTDELGRDIYSRIVHGAWITLKIVGLVALTAPLAGLIVGTVSGYFGGWVDIVLMRFTDVFLAFPRLILALAFVAALEPGIESAILAIALTSWPTMMRSREAPNSRTALMKSLLRMVRVSARAIRA